MAITHKITAPSLDMYPKNIVPFFPVEDALGINVQVFGDLVKSDDKGLGIETVAKSLPKATHHWTFWVAFLGFAPFVQLCRLGC